MAICQTRVVIVSSLECVVNGEVVLADAALEINLHSSPLAPSLFSLLQYSTYLAVDEGRIAAVTAQTSTEGYEQAPKGTNEHQRVRTSGGYERVLGEYERVQGGGMNGRRGV